MRILPTCVSSIILGLACLSCGEADKVENKISCSQVCNRYKDCFDSNYDVKGCTSSCETEANKDEDKDRRLEQCNDCIDDQSCSSSAFHCTTECAGVLL